MPAGRPTNYSEEMADNICSQLATGNSLRKVCSAEDMPDISTIYLWFRKFPEFIEQYARAKVDSGDSDADKIEEIAEKTLDGTYEPAAARVAIDAFKWTASKKVPKKYGERQHIEHSGKIGLADLTNEELQKKLDDLENE